MYTVGQLNESGKRVFATGVAFGGLNTLITIARFSMRLGKDLPAGWDDYFALGALIAYYGLLANNLYADFIIGGYQQLYVKFGHTLSPEAIISYEKALWAGEFPYAICLTMCRLSALWLYRRIFRNKTVQHGSIILATISGLWCLGSLIGVGTSCVPLSKLWTPNEHGHCSHGAYKIWYLVKEVIGAVIDLIIVFLPIRSVIQLQLPFKKKFYLVCIFAVGVFVAVTCLVRIYYVYNPGQSEISSTWGIVWTMIHTGTAVCCISLPLLGPLLTKTSLIAEKTYAHILSSLRSVSSRGGSARSSNHRVHMVRENEETSVKSSNNGADPYLSTWTKQDRHGAGVWSQTEPLSSIQSRETETT